MERINGCQKIRNQFRAPATCGKSGRKKWCFLRLDKVTARENEEILQNVFEKTDFSRFGKVDDTGAFNCGKNARTFHSRVQSVSYLDARVSHCQPKSTKGLGSNPLSKKFCPWGFSSLGDKSRGLGSLRRSPTPRDSRPCRDINSLRISSRTHGGSSGNNFAQLSCSSMDKHLKISNSKLSRSRALCDYHESEKFIFQSFLQRALVNLPFALLFPEMT